MLQFFVTPVPGGYFMSPPERLGERLRALSEFDPPAGGWTRLQRRMERRSRQRRWASAAGLAAAACLCLAVGLHGSGAPRAPAAERQVAVLMERSRSLEDALSQVRPEATVFDSTRATQIAALESSLSLVDLQLTDAPPPAAAVLWKERVELMTALVQALQEAGSSPPPGDAVLKSQVAEEF
jgi:hypothetical protein